jgi:cell wall-associated NlpC family hydrolase
MATETFNIVSRNDTWGNKLIVPGSNLPYFQKLYKDFKIGEFDYSLNGAYSEMNPNKPMRESIIDYALKFFNAPYLWGGRTPYGIDCSGLTQIVYKLNGIKLPRDASQQVLTGDTLSFVEEALPGDLAFFGDEEGLITHVGIIWKHHKIIHASGRVRIDNVDHQGIYNEELKRYTHSLRTIKRIIKE